MRLINISSLLRCKIIGVWQVIMTQCLLLWAKPKCTCARSMIIKTTLKLIWGCDIILWGHNEYVWGQRSVPGHVCPSEVTMNMHEVRGYYFLLEIKTQWKVPHAPKLTSDLMQTHCDHAGWYHTQINIKPVLIFIDFFIDNCIFARLTKIATELSLTVTHQWFCNWGKTRCQFM